MTQKVSLKKPVEINNSTFEVAYDLILLRQTIGKKQQVVLLRMEDLEEIKKALIKNNENFE